MLKKICWLIVLSPSYSTAEGSSSDRLTLLNTTFQVRTFAGVSCTNFCYNAHQTITKKHVLLHSPTVMSSM